MRDEIANGVKAKKCPMRDKIANGVKAHIEDSTLDRIDYCNMAYHAIRLPVFMRIGRRLEEWR